MSKRWCNELILIKRLLTIAQTTERAEHGSKNTVYQTGHQALSISKATLLRKIKQIRAKLLRNQQVDYGTSALTREESSRESSVIMASHRKNSERLYS
ncbi:MAG: hypothetical protein ACTS77_01450 [Arsenophonus sp. NC-TX2-MAG3]